MRKYIDAKKFWNGRPERLDPRKSEYARGWNACLDEFLRVLKDAPPADVVEVPEGGIGNLSDGYHTFNELYHHRAILFSVICNSMPERAWKSKLHGTGDMFDGMFIVGIETSVGQATYHYDIAPYWDMFKVRELSKAPKWDGHTASEAICRIAKLTFLVTRCKECKHAQRDSISGSYMCEFDPDGSLLNGNHFCSWGESVDVE